MFKWINKLLANKYKKEQKPRGQRTLTTEAFERFHPKGEGLFIINLKGTSNSFVAKVIEYFSGKLTHSFIAMYSQDLRSWFNDEQWAKITAKYNYYYGITTGIPTTAKVLVLGSADQDGMNYFDYSHYQNRIQSIRKAPLNSVQIKGIIGWLCQDRVMNANYDYTGLVGWMFRKILPCTDVKVDLYCSELVALAFNSVGLKIAKDLEPSPAQIEEYHKDWIVYSNL